MAAFTTTPARPIPPAPPMKLDIAGQILQKNPNVEYIYDPNDINVPQEDPNDPKARKRIRQGLSGKFYTTRMMADGRYSWVEMRPIPNDSSALTTTKKDDSKSSSSSNSSDSSIPPWWWLYPWTWSDWPGWSDYYWPWESKPKKSKTEYEYHYYYDKKPDSRKGSSSQCNIYQEYNPVTGKCRLKCEDHQERDPSTGRCTTSCEPHQYRNPKTGRCKAY
ncbi:FirrV-1-A16 [Feldmannia irregularis virus a]|uniref:FirrV-1-A16 n=1 Tax=Feldmannia irregularis virus a TaxID=231992 RepID=Q6XM71_9PHYC|nr:FirrV-1-A16 [Feldmannia irregularis virus a]AAR26840.1 FirrV-1-A16 [Feldmannia irregularis virus a]